MSTSITASGVWPWPGWTDRASAATSVGRERSAPTGSGWSGTVSGDAGAPGTSAGVAVGADLGHEIVDVDDVRS